jgi:hypothetical protein
MIDNRGSFRPGKRTIAGLAVAALAAVIVIVLFATHGPRPAPAAVTPATHSACKASGCAVVSLTRTVPQVTVLYGASCSGVYGSWFFNAVEGGGNDQLRPSYALSWSFTPGSKVAKPSGRIVIPQTNSTQVTLTLDQGALTLIGTRKPNAQIAATGSLVVELSGPPTSPALKFTETGLRDAESALGLVSPFDVDGSPLTVPIKTVKSMVGC